MTENNKNYTDIPEELLSEVAGGNDPETMSQEELAALIHRYRDLASRVREADSRKIHQDLHGSVATINACSETAENLQQIYNRRFNGQ